MHSHGAANGVKTAVLIAALSGLTLPPAELERRVKAAAKGQAQPVRASLPV